MPFYRHVAQEDLGERAESGSCAADAASPSLSRSRSARTACARPPDSLARQLQRLAVPATVLLLLAAVVSLSAGGSARFLSSSGSRPKHIVNTQPEGGQRAVRRPRAGAPAAESAAGLPIAREDEVIFQGSPAAAPGSGAASADEAMLRNSTAAPGGGAASPLKTASGVVVEGATSQSSTAAAQSGAASADEVVFRNSKAAPEGGADSPFKTASGVVVEGATSQSSTAAPQSGAASAFKTAASVVVKRATSQNSTAAPTKAPKPERPKIVDLFCWALIVPWGYERELITFQHKGKVGIFGCGTYAVYSNETLDLGGGLKNKLVHISLFAPVGGQWNTLLNTPIFLATWKQVVKDGQFLTAEWTAKVDADAVFFPERLSGLVKAPGHEYPQQGNGMFADNCGYTRSMHGPLELFSRRALSVWSERGPAECERPPQEDVYMRECMVRLGVRELYDFNLLAEQSCFWDWWHCQDQHVAFHPFKTLKDFKGCMRRAKHPTPPPQR